MGTFHEPMFNLSGAVVTTLTSMSSGIGTTAGTYSPKVNGTLKLLTLILVPQAASSLAEHGRVHLTNSKWTPNVNIFWVPGFGLQTVAGRGDDGNVRSHKFPVSLAVSTDSPITGEVIYTGTSPVTPTMIVEGDFEGSP